jgi:S1-C subfamily serine protease
MHTRFTVARAALLGAAAFAVHSAPLAAQVTARRVAPEASLLRMSGHARSALGVTTSPSTSARDTLGLLITAITPGSPAEKAGLHEGDRLTSINGVNLRLAPADIGDRELGDLLARRLIRELDKVAPGTDVQLGVYADGQRKTVTAKTTDPAEIFSADMKRSIERHVEFSLPHFELGHERREGASLGLSLGSFGSVRDTIGVFVVAVSPNGPAAKAGIEEGHRIVSINGIDLRVPREDAGEATLAAARVRRLQRAIDSLTVGAEVELRVVGNGQTRTVRVTTVKGSALGDEHTMMMFRGGGAIAPLVIRRTPR